MVLDEANHLRKYATDKEKSKLDFDTLDIADPTLCIYGQMTDNCHSDRAKELFDKKFSAIGRQCEDDIRAGCVLFTDWIKEDKSWSNLIFSPIEVYITLKGSKNEQLIHYIKGEINTFKP